jgi:Arc/MetJ-type ribon-helix-helix transcriptional regulator
MQIELTKSELQKFVDEQVKAGHFTSPAEVIEAGLARLMLDPGEEDELDAEAIASINRAEAEFERGEGRPLEDVVAELRRKYFGK